MYSVVNFRTSRTIARFSVGNWRFSILCYRQEVGKETGCTGLGGYGNLEGGSFAKMGVRNFLKD